MTIASGEGEENKIELRKREEDERGQRSPDVQIRQGVMFISHPTEREKEANSARTCCINYNCVECTVFGFFARRNPKRSLSNGGGVHQSRDGKLEMIFMERLQVSTRKHSRGARK